MEPAKGSSLIPRSSSAPKLLDRVREAIRAKHCSRRTENAYVDWIRRYILFHRKRHPSDMGASEITAFLTWLASNRGVSAWTQNQALSALLFPNTVVAPLARHLENVKHQHQMDLARGCGRVVLPFALDRKYPNAATEWRWQFVFPASRICTDPRWGPPSRFHLHESVVQKAVAQAARDASITKRVGPHTFRDPPA